MGAKRLKLGQVVTATGRNVLKMGANVYGAKCPGAQLLTAHNTVDHAVISCASVCTCRYIKSFQLVLINKLNPITFITPNTTLVIFNWFYSLIKSLLLETKCVFKNQDLQMFGLKLNNYKRFSLT